MATRLGLPGITAGRRSHDGRARPPPRRDHRRALSRGACLDRGRDRCDPQRQAPRPARHLRYRPALFRAQRDGGRRVPHLRQAVAAAAQRVRPPRRRRRPARRHDRCDRQRPRAARPGFEAPALHLGGERHHRARDVAAAVTGAVPQRSSDAAKACSMPSPAPLPTSCACPPGGSPSARRRTSSSSSSTGPGASMSRPSARNPRMPRSRGARSRDARS